MDGLIDLLSAAQGSDRVVLIWIVLVFGLSIFMRMVWATAKDRAADNKFREDLLLLISRQQSQMADEQKLNRKFQETQQSLYLDVIKRLEGQQSLSNTAIHNLTGITQAHSVAVNSNTEAVSTAVGAIHITQVHIDKINGALQTISTTLDTVIEKLNGTENTLQKVNELKAETSAMRGKLEELVTIIVNESKPLKEGEDDGKLRATSNTVSDAVRSSGDDKSSLAEAAGNPIQPE